MSYRAETLRECPLGCVPPKVMQTGKTRGYFQRSGTENPLFRTSPIGSQVLFPCALIRQALTELHHGNCRFHDQRPGKKALRRQRSSAYFHCSSFLTFMP